jgi:hypothetical protein
MVRKKKILVDDHEVRKKRISHQLNQKKLQIKKMVVRRKKKKNGMA